MTFHADAGRHAQMLTAQRRLNEEKRMTKREVTDAMVKRARECWGKQAAWGPAYNGAPEEGVRLILEAALNPPAEPEIAVSVKMIAAGYEAGGGFYNVNEEQCENIYRAMEGVRRKEGEPKRQGHGHNRRTLAAHMTYYDPYRPHRRSGDPV